MGSRCSPSAVQASAVHFKRGPNVVKVNLYCGSGVIHTRPKRVQVWSKRSAGVIQAGSRDSPCSSSVVHVQFKRGSSVIPA
eukprot:9502854-Pyramimonas_sp.AAC.1